MDTVRLDLVVVWRVKKQLAQFVVLSVVDVATRRAVTLTGSGAVDLRPGSKLLGRLGHSTQVGSVFCFLDQELEVRGMSRRWRWCRDGRKERNNGKQHDASISRHCSCSSFAEMQTKRTSFECMYDRLRTVRFEIYLHDSRCERQGILAKVYTYFNLFASFVIICIDSK
jgi:hypothetical protein